MSIIFLKKSVVFIMPKKKKERKFYIKREMAPERNLKIKNKGKA